MDYEILDHPADIGFRVRAPTRDEAYAKAACALFSLLAKGPLEGDTHQEELVEVEGEDECALLYELLEAALILFETERFHATRARVTITETVDGLALSARLAGSTAAGAGWMRPYDVKAVTYHQMRVVGGTDGWTIEVYVDI